ncbi:MAG: trypsin-like peptidase domain-containing protein [Actinomycetota bacterium]|nr:trypsin-like peptidase domain-containing protein [Actinomycetota bacterium]
MRPHALLLAALIALGTACSPITSTEPQAAGRKPTSEEPRPRPKAPADVLETGAGLGHSGAPAPHSELSTVIEQVLPSIVNVQTTSVVQDVFGDPSQGKGQGSGVVIDEDGVILTNNHVIDGAVSVKVVFNGGRAMEGRVVDAVPERDLAVIKVEASNLKAIVIGRSDSLKLGDEVIALGYPLGLGGPTVTSGIISGENRNIQPQGGVRLEGLLQTDAAINPGNSGGALVDRAGSLVGINTAAGTPAAAENLGFAIAIDGALPIVREILEDPPDQRAWLGVSPTDLDPAAATQLGLAPDLEGALIVEVFPDSPAQVAGIEQGDVVTRIGDTQVRSADDLIAALGEWDPGERAELKVTGAAGSRSETVELGQRPVTQ